MRSLRTLVLLIVVLSIVVSRVQAVTNYVYVATCSSSSVSVISTLTNNVVAAVPVGTGPSWVAISPRGGSIGHQSVFFGFGHSNCNLMSELKRATCATSASPVSVYGLGYSVGRGAVIRISRETCRYLVGPYWQGSR